MRIMIWHRSNDNNSDIHDDNSRAGPHSHLGEDLADETPLEPPHSLYSLLRLSLSLLSLSLLSLTLSSPCSSLLSWIFDTPGTLKPPHSPYSPLRLSLSLLSLSLSLSWSSLLSWIFLSLTPLEHWNLAWTILTVEVVIVFVMIIMGLYFWKRRKKIDRSANWFFVLNYPHCTGL